MRYQHIQRSPLGWLLLLLAMVMAGIAISVAGGSWPLTVLMGVLSVVILVLAMSFGSLTTEDRGDRLLIRYGPLPLFGTSVAYSHITGVEASRSALIDGWGIHYVPGRGWTYNLWGRACVVIARGSSTLRVGTDDAEGLAAFLNSKIGEPGSHAER